MIAVNGRGVALAEHCGRGSMAFALAALVSCGCGSEQTATRKFVDYGHDAGRSTLDAGIPAPHPPEDCNEFELLGSVAGSTIHYCDPEEALILNLVYDGGWVRNALFGEGGVLWMEGPQKPQNLVPLSAAKAVLRLPAGGPLARHWLCANHGVVVPELLDASASDAIQLEQLDDLGTCEGDPASPDWVKFDSRGPADYSTTGSIGGRPVTVGQAGFACGASSTWCEISTEATRSRWVVARASSVIGSGVPVAIQDGFWVEPPGFGVDAFCAGPGSTVTFDGKAHLVIELRGLRALTCAAESPISGSVHGTLE